MRQSRDDTSLFHSAGNPSSVAGRFASEAEALAVLHDGVLWLQTLTGWEAAAVLVEIQAGRRTGGQAVHAAVRTLRDFARRTSHPLPTVLDKKNPGRDDAVHKLLDTEGFLTRQEIHRALFDYDDELVDREIDCGLHNGSIRGASHDKFYRRRSC